MTEPHTPNPLIPELLALLRAAPEGISEFSLMKGLADHDAFANLSTDQQLQLFQKHFMIMHGLYTLQSRLWYEEGMRLEISPLSVRLYEATEMSAAQGQELPGREDPLKAYYLDWSQLETTSAEDVRRLMQGFMDQCSDPTIRKRAYETLGLESGASAADVRARYRQLAAQHHPDRGGDGDAFIEIRRAYEVLRNTELS
ncbi:DnaJ domain-containing protein [Marinobacterium sp. AK62]|uniref:DnaJ domain-containing protein n=1 Tax=Marinobacterium alkalitolerans TaxID=1542925 RepID=A0ABS3Z833_9GAMM|nr:DNA-J related domain-containing protein [Marinobacterium alkalitolerans]MBP0047862.1 DnaJ domain-containing protein [Marinobacterium alkalitolerans]